uniref:CS domain-containing protein n=1 Tax=Hemiselmis tepida TaxID=464990 RepID=A0A7S0VYS5_9CRYP|mmetsp:Transcript_24917/g.63210  ORF Transcript_24917/g.63210 Transcript_24917/m.63210 type:complete len:338 (+) Transcript_24917:59-1072(+)
MADGEDKTETPEERLAFLRSHGVTVETVEDREAAKQGKPPADWGNGREEIEFSYVKIPADESKPYELIKTKGYVAEDCMLTLMKPMFAGGAIDTETAKKTALAQMGSDVSTMGLNHLGDAAVGGVVETFALVRPCRSNDHCGVYIYLDEVGMLKQLPPNPRARSLAAACSFHGADFFGDVFVGRTKCQPAPMRNIDFTLADMDSSSPWLKRASAENYDYGLGMAEIRDTINAQNPGGAPEAEDESTVKEEEGFTWSQSEEDVEICLEVGEGVKAGAVKAQFKPQSLAVTVGGEKRIDVELYDKVRPDDCNWTMSKGKVTITLEKVREGRWTVLRRVV